MMRTGKSSNVTAAEIRQIAAALAAKLPPPEEIEPRKGGVLCVHARDTGIPAFAGLPCRGNRIECKKTGVFSYAARCRSDIECKFYTEDET
jgi:hypothetical protein